MVLERPALPAGQDYRIGPDGFDQATRLALLDKLYAHLTERADHSLEYQVRQDLKGTETLGRFLRHHINNAGDSS
ncbi:hypothetical protein [Actinomadura sp. KC06]|uniref:hypothetical protein n=1 Tax=Actinomadura sp. KC06 TaxID=2530369 RepID=UPI001FB5FAD2|nr:hypothetical protein [Actinomadura sp. KC06]